MQQKKQNIFSDEQLRGSSVPLVKLPDTETLPRM